jgi:hypothetical protein
MSLATPNPPETMAAPVVVDTAFVVVVTRTTGVDNAPVLAR